MPIPESKAEPKPEPKVPEESCSCCKKIAKFLFQVVACGVGIIALHRIFVSNTK